MSEHDELTAGERDALRALAADTPADPAQEEATLARLRAAGLLGGVPARYRLPPAARFAIGAAAAILVYLAGVYSGRATAGGTTPRVPTATAPEGGPGTQSATVAANAPSSDGMIIRF